MRKLISVLAATAMTVAFALPARAQAVTDLKIMAPAGPGGGWDTAARSVQSVLTSTGLVRNVQVFNVPGAGGTVGLAQFTNAAKGNPKELMLAGITLVGAILTNKSPTTLEAVTPLARLTADPLTIVVLDSSPIKSLKDVAAMLKLDPGKVSWAGGSAGGADHILAGLFAKAAGVDPTKVNYIAFSGGGEALAGLLSGRMTVGVSGYGEFESQIKAGKLRALAVSFGDRIPGVDVPTFKEQGYDIELGNWRGIFAGPDISAADKAALSDVIGKLVKSPQWAEVLKTRGWSDYYLPADEFAAFIKADQARVGDVLRSIGLVK